MVRGFLQRETVADGIKFVDLTFAETVVWNEGIQ